jgi:hypothetical protein
MCMGCTTGLVGEDPRQWPDYKPVMGPIVDLVRRLYEDHPVGGPLHIQLDDWNVEDHHIWGWWDASTRDIFGDLGEFGWRHNTPVIEGDETWWLCFSIMWGMSYLTPAERSIAVSYAHRYVAPLDHGWVFDDTRPRSMR